MGINALFKGVLLATLLMVLSLGLAACGGVGAGDSGSHAGDGAPRVSFDSDAAKEKLGEDDDAQAVIFYGA